MDTQSTTLPTTTTTSSTTTTISHNTNSTTTSNNDDPINRWLKQGELAKLEQAVLDGYGHQLTGRTSRLPQVNRFLKQVPDFQAKIQEIHRSVQSGNYRSVQHLIDRKRYAFCRDQMGSTPLHKAVIYGHNLIVDYLLDRYGSTIHARDHRGRTALHYSAVVADGGHIYRQLLEAGADTMATDMFGKKPEDYLAVNQSEISAQVLREGANFGPNSRAPVAQQRRSRRLDRNIDPSSIKFYTSRSLMHRSNIKELIRQGNLSTLEEVVLQGFGDRLLGETSTAPLVQEFLDKLPDFIDQINELHHAAMKGNLREFQGLLDRKSMITARDQIGATPLHKTVLYGHYELAEYIATNFPVTLDARDNDGRTALHYASALDDDRQFYNMLVKAGASTLLPDLKGKNADFYLRFPEQINLQQIIKRSQRLNANYTINTANRIKSKSPSRRKERSLSPSYRLKRPSDAAANGIGITNGRSAAAAGGGAGGAGSSSSNGDNTSEETLSEKSSTATTGADTGDTIGGGGGQKGYGRKTGGVSSPSAPRLDVSSANLKRWIQENNIEMLEGVVLEGYGNRLKEKAEYFTDDDSGDSMMYITEMVPKMMNQIRVVHAAVSCGDLSGFRDTLDGGDNRDNNYVLAKDHLGMAPIHKATIMGHMDVVDYILDKFPETVNCRDKEGRTALHYAAATTNRNGSKIYKVLVKAGADPRIRDSSGKTAEYYRVHLLSLPNELSRINSRKKLNPLAKYTADTSSAANNTGYQMATGAIGRRRPVLLANTQERIAGALNAGDIKQLQELVLDGYGDSLIGRTSWGEEARKFLKGLPHLMDQIKTLHASVGNNDIGNIDRILSDDSTLIRAKDENGLLAIHIATAHNRPEVVDYLITNYPQCIQLKDSVGRTALHISAQNKSIDIYRKLVDSGGDPKVMDKSGKTADHYFRQQTIQNYDFVSPINGRKMTEQDINIISNNNNNNNSNGFVEQQNSINLRKNSKPRAAVQTKANNNNNKTKSSTISDPNNDNKTTTVDAVNTNDTDDNDLIDDNKSVVNTTNNNNKSKKVVPNNRQLPQLQHQPSQQLLLEDHQGLDDSNSDNTTNNINTDISETTNTITTATANNNNNTSTSELSITSSTSNSSDVITEVFVGGNQSVVQQVINDSTTATATTTTSEATDADNSSEDNDVVSNSEMDGDVVTEQVVIDGQVIVDQEVDEQPVPIDSSSSGSDNSEEVNNDLVIQSSNDNEIQEEEENEEKVSTISDNEISQPEEQQSVVINENSGESSSSSSTLIEGEIKTDGGGEGETTATIDETTTIIEAQNEEEEEKENQIITDKENKDKDNNTDDNEIQMDSQSEVANEEKEKEEEDSKDEVINDSQQQQSDGQSVEQQQQREEEEDNTNRQSIDKSAMLSSSVVATDGDNEVNEQTVDQTEVSETNPSTNRKTDDGRRRSSSKVGGNTSRRSSSGADSKHSSGGSRRSSGGGSRPSSQVRRQSSKSSIKLDRQSSIAEQVADADDDNNSGGNGPQLQELTENQEQIIDNANNDTDDKKSGQSIVDESLAQQPTEDSGETVAANDDTDTTDTGAVADDQQSSAVVDNTETTTTAEAVADEELVANNNNNETTIDQTEDQEREAIDSNDGEETQQTVTTTTGDGISDENQLIMNVNNNDNNDDNNNNEDEEENEEKTNQIIDNNNNDSKVNADDDNQNTGNNNGVDNDTTTATTTQQQQQMRSTSGDGGGGGSRSTTPGLGRAYSRQSTTTIGGTINPQSDDRLNELISHWLMDADLLRLEHVVIAGQGDRLIGRKSNNNRVQDFLDLVPTYMSKIRTVHDTVIRGNLNEVKQVLTRKRFALSRDHLGSSPLHLSVLHGHLDVMLYIIQQFPETINGPDNEGRIPLHYAAIMSDPNKQFYKLLSKAGADASLTDKAGHNPEYYLETPGVLTIRQLLENYMPPDDDKANGSAEVWHRPPTADIESRLTPTPDNGTDADSDTSVVYNVNRGQEVDAEVHVDADDNNNNNRRSVSRSVSQSSMTSTTNRGGGGGGGEGEATELAEEGDEDFETMSNEYRKSLKEEKERLQKSYERQMSGSSTTSSSAATTATTASVVSVNGRVVDNIQKAQPPYDGSNGAAVGVAIANGANTAGYDLTEIKDENGQTIMHLLAAKPHQRTVFYKMLSQAEYLIPERDAKYRTMRDITVENGIKDNLRAIDLYILDSFVNENRQFIRSLALEGYDSLLTVVDGEGHDVMAILKRLHKQRMQEMVKDLAQFQKNRDELHTFIRHGYVEGVDQLIQLDSNLVVAKSQRGRHALHISVLFANLDIISSLIESNPRAVNTPDHMGRTPLHYAMASSLVEDIGRVLIRAGANRQLRDVKMRTPSYYFVYKNDIKEIKLEEQNLTI